MVHLDDEVITYRPVSDDCETDADERHEARFRPMSDAGSLSRGERLRMRIEHEIDTRSVRFAVWLLRKTRGRAVRPWHRRALLLTTKGRRTGRRRTVPLQYFPDGNDMIVVAANSGLPSPPGWYFNLTAHPAAIAELDGRTLPVRAEELAPEQAATFWPCILGMAPDYARYPRRTSRSLPLVRLVPDPAAITET